MSRLLSTAATDIRLQRRNGFYYAVAFVVAVWAVVVWQLPDLDWGPWLAPLVFGNLVVATFYFMGGLVLLEKAEGTLEALVVTPLRVREYLGAKLLTLCVLSLAESVVLVTLAQGFDYSLSLLALGVLVTSVLYVLSGFLVVARYDSISEYLMPSVMWVTLLSLPFLVYVQPGWGPWMLAHPMGGSLVLLRAGFEGISGGELAVAIATSGAWMALLGWRSGKAFQRFVVRREGVR